MANNNNNLAVAYTVHSQSIYFRTRLMVSRACIYFLDLRQIHSADRQLIEISHCECCSVSAAVLQRQESAAALAALNGHGKRINVWLVTTTELVVH